MWVLPLISGAAVGLASGTQQAALPVFWFSIAAAAGFLAYQPLEALMGFSLLKTRSDAEKHLALTWTVAAAALGTLSVVQLIRLGRGRVLLFATLALGCFGVRWLFGKARSLRASKQIIGALGLTSAAAGSYYVTTGKIDSTALLLWGANWLFAAGQIEFVQLCIRTMSAPSRAEKLWAGQMVFIFHLTLVAAAITAAQMGLVSALLAVAFIPAVVRLIIWGSARPQKIDFHMLGFSELFLNVVFCALLAAAFVVRG
jgi:hypothetical protein